MTKPVQTLGIDVSKAKLDYCLVGKDGELKREGIVSNDQSGAEELDQICRGYADPGSTRVIIESTGDYHLLTTMALRETGYLVNLINPLITKQYLKANIRKCKTDKMDARLLARIGIMGGDDLSVFHTSAEEVRLKKKVSLVHQLTKTKQQMKAALDQAKKTLTLLGETSSTGMEVTEKAVKELENGIKELEKEIVEAKRNDPMVKQLAGIPGVSEQSAVLVMTEIAGKTFATKEKLTAFAGMDVSVRQSGSSVQGKGKLSKRGSPSLRRTLFLIAWGLKQHNEAFKRLYDYHRGKNKHYTAVLNILARKFLHVLFGMMKTQTPFNPDLIVLPS